MEEPDSSIAYRLGRWVSGRFTRPGWMVSALRGSGPEQVEAERKWAVPLFQAARRQFEAAEPPPASSPFLRAFAKLSMQPPVPGWTFSLHWFRSDRPGWTALPGGYLFASRAMLSWVPSPDVFAFLIAHEMAHQMLRHCLRRAVWEQGLGAAARVPVLGRKPARLQTLLQSGYTLEQEREADLAAARHCRNVGISLEPIMRFWAQMQEEKRPLPQPLLNHPPLVTRIQTVSSLTGTS